jgi:hypothetical protein
MRPNTNQNRFALIVTATVFCAAAMAARAVEVAPVKNANYTKECSGCHFAFQPGLLPARSWEKIFAQLDQHFGETITLKPELVTELRAYAVENAADHSSADLSKLVLGRVADSQTPIRIAQLPYMRKHHGAIQMVKQLKTIANCSDCHPRAPQGEFDSGDFVTRDNPSGMRYNNMD